MISKPKLWEHLDELPRWWFGISRHGILEKDNPRNPIAIAIIREANMAGTYERVIVWFDDWETVKPWSYQSVDYQEYFQTPFEELAEGMEVQYLPTGRMFRVDPRWRNGNEFIWVLLPVETNE